jgi:hypothetical protein
MNALMRGNVVGGVVCPKCTSRDVHQLSRLHHDGRPSGPDGVPAEAANVGDGDPVGNNVITAAPNLPALAPPRRRDQRAWAVLSAGCALAAAVLVAGGWPGAVVLACAAAASAWQAHETRAFNSRAWPALQAVWERSYVCARCGEIFLPD